VASTRAPLWMPKAMNGISPAKLNDRNARYRSESPLSGLNSRSVLWSFCRHFPGRPTPMTFGLAAPTDLELAAQFCIGFPVGGLLVLPLAAVLFRLTGVLSHRISLSCGCVRQAICGNVLYRKLLDRRFLRNFFPRRIEVGVTWCGGFERKRCGRNWRVAALAGHAAAGERERATQQGNNSCDHHSILCEEKTRMTLTSC
jgi:hypothetical protein